MTNPAHTTTFKAPQSSSPRLTRRDVLKKTVAVAGTMAMPSVVMARALGKDGQTAPSDRILLGGIGLGGRGQTVLREMLDEPDV